MGAQWGRFQRHDGSGRTRATAHWEDKLIVRSAVSVPDPSLSIIRRATHTRVFTMTIHIRLIERSLRSYRPLRHLPLTSAHCDESRFQLCPDDHRQRVWRRPEQHADPAFTIARHTGSQPGQNNARPHTARVAMNYLTASQTLPWPARSLSNRACLGYDCKATASTREYR
ncbi:HTH_Tnp_Tc3_2 domain-containing protein [Trichonephila clavipes]|nr:HTH_Tnp_Tc3_2 domain-containing protein [Trichonephila clavipes]